MQTIGTGQDDSSIQEHKDWEVLQDNDGVPGARSCRSEMLA